MSRLFSIFSMLAMFFVLTASLPAGAFSLTDTGTGKDYCSRAGSNGPSGSAACKDNTGTDPIGGTDGALADITNIVAIIAGIAAIIMIIISGLRFITAGGDSAGVTTARKTLVGALIGLAVIVLARSLIIYVIGQV